MDLEPRGAWGNDNGGLVCRCKKTHVETMPEKTWRMRLCGNYAVVVKSKKILCSSKTAKYAF